MKNSVDEELTIDELQQISGGVAPIAYAAAALVAALLLGECAEDDSNTKEEKDKDKKTWIDGVTCGIDPNHPNC